MTATLTTLRDRVELMLADSGNSIWSTDDIDEAIRQALHEYSKTRPLRAVSTVTLSADGRSGDRYFVALRAPGRVSDMV